VGCNRLSQRLHRNEHLEKRKPPKVKAVLKKDTHITFEVGGAKEALKYMLVTLVCAKLKRF
jgi:hypothetical protein